MHNFWAYVAAMVFGPMVALGIIYMVYVLATALFGDGACPNPICQ